MDLKQLIEDRLAVYETELKRKNAARKRAAQLREYQDILRLLDVPGWNEKTTRLIGRKIVLERLFGIEQRD